MFFILKFKKCINRVFLVQRKLLVPGSSEAMKKVVYVQPLTEDIPQLALDSSWEKITRSTTLSFKILLLRRRATWLSGPSV